MDEIKKKLNYYSNIAIINDKLEYGMDFITSCGPVEKKWLYSWKNALDELKYLVSIYVENMKYYNKSENQKILKEIIKRYKKIREDIYNSNTSKYYSGSCVKFRSYLYNIINKDIDFFDRLLINTYAYDNSIRRNKRRRKSTRKIKSKRKSRAKKSGKPYSVKIQPSTTKEKKYMAIFYDKDKNKIKTTHFGAKGYEDLTIHKDLDRKKRYINRHRKRENWNDPMSAGALSRYILWQYPSFKKSVKYYKNKFNLK